MEFIDRVLFRERHTCPWWLCFTFDNPLRRLIQDPALMLRGLVQPGQTVLDIGCGMGYFSLPLARLVGQDGEVICVDMQARMLEAARHKAAKAGLDSRMRFQRCTENSLGLTTAADFALTFWMVHEVAQRDKFLREINESLKPSGTLLIAEPRLHVTRAEFKKTVTTALQEGFVIAAERAVSMSMAVLLRKI
jgi:ubiquinone/menaquinone biosynthesis C-methylase UbiE